MSVDARSLLKAKRQEERIQHPYATYSANGQLKCTLCSLVIKYASGWQGHLGSKGHRMAVATEKRKREVEEMQDEKDEEEEERRKRAKTEEKEEDSEEEEEQATSGFPNDFFSGSNRPVGLPKDDEDEEEEGGGGRQPNPTAQPVSALDEEYALFTRTVVNVPALSERQHDLYQAATVTAEAEMADLTPAGFPAQETEQAEAPPEKKEETEEERRVREHELIMDRILDEERAQEEADERVVMMKAKLDALKLRRLQKKTVH